MKKIAQSLLMLIVITAAVGGATSAYFSDTETSTDNTFQAGQIDLEVGNAGYYNDAVNPGTTWSLDDLDAQLFFNFLDVKPEDWGENTTTLRFEDNPAYLCANITLTSAAENGVNDPEGDDGDNAAALGNWDGELDDQIRFIAWADDGDNVYEDNETLILDDYASSLPQFDGNTGASYPIADANVNIYGAPGTALTPATPYYIGHAWCFGDMTLSPVAAGSGVNPTVDPGFTCDGASVDNTAQSDRLVGNMSFYAVQYRHNADFDCTDWNPNI